MGELMMVEEGASVLDGLELPLFYMNDYSVLGLVVSKLLPTIDLLEADGFFVARKKRCARILFNTRRELNQLFDTLDRNRVAYGTADLVSQAYQG